MHANQPHGLSVEPFLRQYWQQRPHLYRKAFAGFDWPITPDELAGLACEADVESRIVLEHPGQTPAWSVRHGPFSAADFAALPDSHWTLLVQDVDKHVPECAALLDHFRFLPDWRIDDLMVSYAAPGGSVGPHVDAYDVFLIQALGERRWLLDNTPNTAATVSDVPLKLLADFNVDHDDLLGDGDMLYLPPNVGHHGIAETECMTLSVGFRAPSHAEMLADFAGWLARKADPEVRYEDADLAAADVTPGAIDTFARRRIRTLLRAYLNTPDTDIDRWFGCFITEPKPWLATAPTVTPLTPRALQQRLAVGTPLHRSPYSRIHFAPGEAQSLILFVDGEALDIAACDAAFARQLAQHKTLEPDTLLPALDSAYARELLAALYNAGKFYFAHDDE